MTIAEMIRRFAAERPDHPAIAGACTYAELDAASNRAAQTLRAAGVDAGDRVAILDRNSVAQLEAVFGAAKLGAVPVPINWRLAAPEIEAIVDDAQAKVVLVSDEFELDGLPIGEWSDDDTDPGYEPAADDVGVQFYSSGTTGRPKGVELTHANVYAVLSLWDDAAGLGSEAVNLVALPMFHIGGMALALAGHCVGATNVLLSEATPGGVLEALTEHGVTHMGMVPALLQAMVAVDGVQDMDFSALQSVIYGASPINDTVLNKLLSTFHCRFFQAYGLTETASTVVMLRPEDHDAEHLRSCGKPVDGTQVRIITPEGEEAAPGEVGEIQIKGPSVMKGYWNLPEETAAAVEDGWFLSGDAGYFDADGFLFLHDRVKDMIVSGGENIYPAEVENALARHPGVGEVAVIGVPSERWGETVKAVVVRAGEVEEDELLDHCRSLVARYKCPTSVDWVDELPRNAVGKVLKRELRKGYWEGQDRAIG